MTEPDFKLWDYLGKKSSVLCKGVWFVKVIATFYLTLYFHTEGEKSELSDINT